MELIRQRRPRSEARKSRPAPRREGVPEAGRRSGRPARLLVRCALVGALAGASLALFGGGVYFRHRLPELLQDRGANGPLPGSLAATLRHQVESLRANLSELTAGEELPVVVLDIAHEHITRLREKRATALARGILESGPDDYVPAAIRLADRNVPVQVRLKGDLLDHLRGDKWSLRVKVRRGKSIFGLRRFSLQHPRTRGYHLDPLFQDQLRRLGVLAVRHRFVRLVVNGEDRGVMDCEEHFSKELLESQSRREGVIFGFDDRAAWQWLADADEWLEMPEIYPLLDPFRAGKVAKDPILAEQCESAEALVRGYFEGLLPAHEVFDADLWGRFLAACEVWHTVHSAEWSNIRFYYNPVSALIEPIGYDSYGPARPHHTLLDALSLPLLRRLLGDAEIRGAFVAHLHALARSTASEETQAFLAGEDLRYRRQLLPEFPLVARLDIDAMVMRARRLLGVTEVNAFRLHRSARPFPRPLEVLRVSRAQEQPGGRVLLDLINLTKSPVEVVGVEFAAPGEGFRPAPAGTCALPIAVDGRVEHEPSAPRRAVLELPATAAPPERVRLVGRSTEPVSPFHVEARSFAAAARAPVIPEPDPRFLEQSFPFLERDADAHTFRITVGTHRVDEPLVLPRGWGLEIAPGATLLFAAGAHLVVRGSFVAGEAGGATVVLAPAPVGGEGEGREAGAAAGWPGVFVHSGDEPCRWTGVEVRETTGVRRHGWPLTGGVTLFRSRVELDDCAFVNNEAEDALNCVNSTVALRDVRFTGTRSDALDCDFCEGSIAGGSYAAIGGDGIDLSGSRIEIRGVALSDVRDKAISVGEASDATAVKCTIRRVGTGVASKDGSRVRVADTTLSEVRYVGVMTYRKKNEYSPGSAAIEGVSFADTRTPFLAQTGSRLEVDGVQQPTQDVDVEELYRTGSMRK